PADRVTAGRYANHSADIIFGLDHGGNEREQLFLLRDGVLSDVVVDPEVMHMFGAISPDDTRMAFSDNRRDPAFFDVYVCEMDGSGERCVYQQDGSNFVADWSQDGRYLLIERRVGALNGELFLLDLE